jgi:hypothetical protein
MTISNLLTQLANSISAKIQDLVAKLKDGSFVVKSALEAKVLKGTNGDLTADQYLEFVNTTSQALGQVKKDIGSASQSATDYTDAKFVDAKAYTDNQISAIVDINKDGVINSIKEIVEVIGSDKQGVESIFTQLGTKATKEEVANLGTFTYDLEKRFTDRNAVVDTTFKTISDETNASFAEIKNGINSATSIINSISF